MSGYLGPAVTIAPSAAFREDQSRFGRIYAPDLRDFDFPMERSLRAMSRAELKRRTQAPRRGPTLNQIGPTCVMYSDATALAAQPLNYTKNAANAIYRVSTPVVDNNGIAHNNLYDYAQANDEWPGTNYEGTSVRAGQEYLLAVGLSSAYVWARDWAELVDYISRVGSAPVILGIDWTEGMDVPIKRRDGYYIEPTGRVLGGHAICALWFDKKRDALKLQNTWGGSWGADGIVYLAKDHAETLIFRWNGEAASFTEKIAA